MCLNIYIGIESNSINLIETKINENCDVKNI